MALYDVNTIISQGRLESQVSETNYPDSPAIYHLNDIYQEVCDDIKALNENYFKARITFDTVPFQNSYSFTAATDTTVSFEKLLNIAIKYTNSNFQDFQPNHHYSRGEYISRSADGLTYVAKSGFTSWATFSSTNRQQVYLSYLQASEQNFYNEFVDNYNGIGSTNSYPYLYQSASAPQYMVVNNGFNIYPYVQETVKEGIIVDYIQTTKDLVIWGTESSILIERNYLRILKYGLIWKSYQYQKLLNEKNDAYAIYQREKDKILNLISNRSYNTQDVQTPYLAYLT